MDGKARAVEKGQSSLPTSKHHQGQAKMQPQLVRLILASKGGRLYKAVLRQLGAAWENKLRCFWLTDLCNSVRWNLGTFCVDGSTVKSQQSHVTGSQNLSMGKRHQLPFQPGTARGT